MIIPLTGMLLERAVLNQVKTPSSRSLFLPTRVYWLDSYAPNIFFLFAIHVEMVFFFAPYSSATLFFVPLRYLIFGEALYFSVIETFNLFIFHTCSGALRHLWKMRILLF